MSGSVFALLMLAALGHAVWNAISRRIPERDAFFTLILMVAVVLCAPVAGYLLQSHPIPVRAWPWMGLSTCFEVLYFAALAKAYQRGTFLTVYPVARGSAPIVATVLSITLMRQSVTGMGLVGILITVMGILLIHQEKFLLRDWGLSLTHPGARWALVTGSCTACYSVADGMGAAIMSPILFKYIVFVGMCAGKLLYDHRFAHRVSYLQLVRRYPVESVIGGALVFGVNAMVVSAMRSTPVAFVSATREVSIVFATLIGVIWLRERLRPVSVLAILLIFAGVVIIKVS